MCLALTLLSSYAALASDPEARASSFSLSPSSRFTPIVALRWDDVGQRYILTEDAAEKESLTSHLQGDAAFLYLNLLIGQFLKDIDTLARLGMGSRGARSRLDQLKNERLARFIEGIGRDLPHIDMTPFRFAEMSWEKDAIYLPYEDVTLRYFLPKQGRIPAGDMMEIPLGDGSRAAMAVLPHPSGVPDIREGLSAAELKALVREMMGRILRVDLVRYQGLGSAGTAEAEENVERFLAGVMTVMRREKRYIAGRDALEAYLASRFGVRKFVIAGGKSTRMGDPLVPKPLKRPDGVNPIVKLARYSAAFGNLDDVVISDAYALKYILKDDVTLDDPMKKRIIAAIRDEYRKFRTVVPAMSESRDALVASVFAAVEKSSVVSSSGGGEEVALGAITELLDRAAQADPGPETAFLGDKVRYAFFKAVIADGRCIDDAKARFNFGKRASFVVDPCEGHGMAYCAALEALEETGRLGDARYAVIVYGDSPKNPRGVNYTFISYLRMIAAASETTGETPAASVAVKSPVDGRALDRARVFVEKDAVTGLSEWNAMAPDKQDEARILAFAAVVLRQQACRSDPRSVLRQALDLVLRPPMEKTAEWGKKSAAQRREALGKCVPPDDAALGIPALAVIGTTGGLPGISSAALADRIVSEMSASAIDEAVQRAAERLSASPYYTNANIIIYDQAWSARERPFFIRKYRHTFDPPVQAKKSRLHEYWASDFVNVACAAGKRVLLVIIGKGAPEALKNPEKAEAYAFDAWAAARDTLKDHATVDPAAQIIGVMGDEIGKHPQEIVADAFRDGSPDTVTLSGTVIIPDGARIAAGTLHNVILAHPVVFDTTGRIEYAVPSRTGEDILAETAGDLSFLLDGGRYIPGAYTLAELAPEDREDILRSQFAFAETTLSELVAASFYLPQFLPRHMERLLKNADAVELTIQQIKRHTYFGLYQCLAYGGIANMRQFRMIERLTAAVREAVAPDMRAVFLAGAKEDPALLRRICLASARANLFSFAIDSGELDHGLFADVAARRVTVPQALADHTWDRFGLDGMQDFEKLVFGAPRTFVFFTANIAETEADVPLWTFLAMRGHRVVVAAKNRFLFGDSDVMGVTALLGRYHLTGPAQLPGAITVIPSGTSYEGVFLDQMSPELRDALLHAPDAVIISKGQANIFTLSSRNKLSHPVVSIFLSKSRASERITGMGRYAPVAGKKLFLPVVAVIPAGERIIESVSREGGRETVNGNLQHFADVPDALSAALARPTVPAVIEKRFMNGAYTFAELTRKDRAAILPFQRKALTELCRMFVPGDLPASFDELAEAAFAGAERLTVQELRARFFDLVRKLAPEETLRDSAAYRNLVALDRQVRRRLAPLMDRVLSIDVADIPVARSLFRELALLSCRLNLLDISMDPGIFDKASQALASASDAPLQDFLDGQSEGALGIDGLDRFEDIVFGDRQRTFVYCTDNIGEADADALLWAFLAKMGHRVVVAPKSGFSFGDADVRNVTEVIAADARLAAFAAAGALSVIPAGVSYEGVFLERLDPALRGILSSPDAVVISKGQANTATLIARNRLDVPVVTMFLSKSVLSERMTGIFHGRDGKKKLFWPVVAVVPPGEQIMECTGPAAFEGTLQRFGRVSARAALPTKEQETLPREPDLARERMVAADLRDAIVVRAADATRRGSALILGLDVTWMPALAGAQDVVNQLERFCDEMRGRGLSVVFVRNAAHDTSDALAGMIQKVRAEQHAALSDICVIGSAAIAEETSAFAAFRSAEGEPGAILAGVDATSLSDISAVRVIEMFLLAMQLGEGRAIADLDTAFIKVTPILDGRDRVFIFRPVEPYDIGEFRKANEIQIEEIDTKA